MGQREREGERQNEWEDGGAGIPKIVNEDEIKE